ncbi:unnamed protein product, partial [Effrenium voratum]
LVLIVDSSLARAGGKKYEGHFAQRSGKDVVARFGATQKRSFRTGTGKGARFGKPRCWKMNNIYKTTGWVYCARHGAGPWPAEGRWSSEGTTDPNGAGRPPSLVLIDEPLPRTVGEENGAIVLEDGQKVLKREENKSWRWSEVLVRSKEDILRSLEREAEGPSGLRPGFLEPRPAQAKAPPKPRPAEFWEGAEVEFDRFSDGRWVPARIIQRVRHGIY